MKLEIISVSGIVEDSCPNKWPVLENVLRTLGKHAHLAAVG